MARESLAAIDPARILFIKPSSLGDIVHAVPAFNALRRRFPAAGISWLVFEEFAGIVEQLPGLGEAIVADRRGGWRGVIAVVRGKRFDLAVDLQGLLRSGWLARGSGAPIRIGLSDSREGAGLFYTHRVLVPPGTMHAVERYGLAAEALGGRFDPAAGTLPVTPGAKEKVDNIFREARIEGGAPLVGLAPGGRWKTKRWPPERFAMAGREIVSRLGASVAVIGSAEEAGICEAVAGGISGAVSLAGRTAVADLPALAERLDALLTNDCGFMHVAAAMGVPVVAIFGPTDPDAIGPYIAAARVLRAPVPCGPCRRRTCWHLTCLERISADEAADAVAVLIKAGRERQAVSAG
ncbi:MAG: glycosyltransferase family 9 protein [Nitrospirota bacterium]